LLEVGGGGSPLVSLPRGVGAPTGLENQHYEPESEYKGLLGGDSNRTRHVRIDPSRNRQCSESNLVCLKIVHRTWLDAQI
jgi:hypothetical protein